MNLIAAATELRYNILGQKSGIAASHIHINIFHTDKAVEDGFKLAQKLYLIKQYIVHPVICDLLFQIRHQHIRVLKPLVFKSIKSNFYDVLFIHSLRKKMLLEKIEQQIGLSAPTNPGDDLDKAVVLLADELIQVGVSFHDHTFKPPIEFFCVHAHFYSIVLYPIRGSFATTY